MKRLKLLRKQKNISQIELAAYLNMKSSAISRYESGIREPDINVIIKIADFFGVSTDYLLGNSQTAKHDPAVDERTPEYMKIDKEIDREMQLLYNQLNEKARTQVKGYIHRLLEENDPH